MIDRPLEREYDWVAYRQWNTYTHYSQPYQIYNRQSNISYNQNFHWVRRRFRNPLISSLLWHQRHDNFLLWHNLSRTPTFTRRGILSKFGHSDVGGDKISWYTREIRFPLMNFRWSLCFRPMKIFNGNRETKRKSSTCSFWHESLGQFVFHRPHELSLVLDRMRGAYTSCRQKGWGCG